jgi:hypothetical protein
MTYRSRVYLIISLLLSGISVDATQHDVDVLLNRPPYDGSAIWIAAIVGGFGCLILLLFTLFLVSLVLRFKQAAVITAGGVGGVKNAIPSHLRATATSPESGRAYKPLSSLLTPTTPTSAVPTSSGTVYDQSPPLSPDDVICYYNRALDDDLNDVRMSDTRRASQALIGEVSLQRRASPGLITDAATTSRRGSKFGHGGGGGGGEGDRAISFITVRTLAPTDHSVA